MATVIYPAQEDTLQAVLAKLIDLVGIKEDELESLGVDVPDDSATDSEEE